VEQPLHNLPVRIYPNPALDVVWLEIQTETAPPATVTLFDALGRQLYATLLQSDKVAIPLEGLPPGVMWLQLANKTQRFQVKIIHQP
jgi:hypothetical protein